VDDVITITDSAEIQTYSLVGVLSTQNSTGSSDGETNGGVIVSKFANGYIVNVQSESGTEIGVRFLKDYGTSNGIWSVTGVKLQSENDIVIVYDTDTSATAPTMYINGTPFTPTLDLAPGGTLTSDAGSDFLIGARAGGSYAFDGEIGLVELLNFAPTAAEVKSLISGNLDFKWQYGSQTSVVTGDDSDFDTDTGNWINNSGAVFDGVVGDWAGGAGTGIGKITLETGGGANSVYLASLLTVGKAYRISVKAKLLTGASVLMNAGMWTASSSGGFGGIL